MADFEDANSPTWANQVGGHVNLIDAIEGTIEYTSSEGKEYALGDDVGDAARAPARLAPAREAPADRRRAGRRARCSTSACTSSTPPAGSPSAAAASSSTCPSSSTTSRRGCGTTRSRSPRTRSGSTRGTLRATVLIETLPAAFQMDEILYELREHSLGPQRRPLGLHLLDDQVLPRPAGVRAARPQRREDDGAVHARLLRAAGQDVPRARRVRDGRHGGADPVAQGPRGQRARDRRRARGQAARGRGRLRRHLGRAPRRRRRWRRRSSTACSATARTRSTGGATTCRCRAADLLDAASTPGEITEAGLRSDVNVGFQYISFWLGGRGAAGIDNLMEDAATAEISRSQIWQWVRHGKVTRERVLEVLDEEMAKIRAEVGDEVWEKGRPGGDAAGVRAGRAGRGVPGVPHAAGVRAAGLRPRSALAT